MSGLTPDKQKRRRPKNWPRYIKQPRKFELNESSLWHPYLQENGYVILKGVLSVQECRVAMGLVFDYLEELNTGINRHDPSTWGKENWPDQLDAGILPWYGVGQSKAMWYVRGKASVRKAFATIWGGEQLLTSFDGMCLFRPWGRDPSWKTASNWYHVDQHPIHKPRFECVQSLVNLLPSSEHTGGNVLIPRSHKTVLAHLRGAYPDALSKLPKGDDFFAIPSDDAILRGSGSGGGDEPVNEPVMLAMGCGDMLMWDSRLIHASMPAPSLHSARTAASGMAASVAAAEESERKGRLGGGSGGGGTVLVEVEDGEGGQVGGADGAVDGWCGEYGGGGEYIGGAGCAEGEDGSNEGREGEEWEYEHEAEQKEEGFVEELVCSPRNNSGGAGAASGCDGAGAAGAASGGSAGSAGSGSGSGGGSGSIGSGRMRTSWVWVPCKDLSLQGSSCSSSSSSSSSTVQEVGQKEEEGQEEEGQTEKGLQEEGVQKEERQEEERQEEERQEEERQEEDLEQPVKQDSVNTPPSNPAAVSRLDGSAGDGGDGAACGGGDVGGGDGDVGDGGDDDGDGGGGGVGRERAARSSDARSSDDTSISDASIGNEIASKILLEAAAVRAARAAAAGTAAGNRIAGHDLSPTTDGSPLPPLAPLAPLPPLAPIAPLAPIDDPMAYGLLRAAMFVCMTPREKAPQEV
jgi:hypothetical protein